MKILSKKSYYNARNLGYSLRHRHRWMRFFIKKGKHKKYIQDSTGGFLQCSICGEIVFIEPKQFDKYKELVKRCGVENISVTVKRKLGRR